MADVPKVVITGQTKAAVYHLWKNVQVEDSFEVTNKSGRGASNAVLLTTRLPSQVNIEVMCSDELVVPTVSNEPNAETQGTTTMEQQIETLRGFVGQVVTIDARTIPGGITGVINRVTVTDDGKWDNTVQATLVMQQILGVGTDGQPLGVDVAFGKITVPTTDSTDPGGSSECVPGQARLFSPQIRSVRESVSNAAGKVKKGVSGFWSKGKGLFNKAKKNVSDFGDGLADAGRALTGKQITVDENNKVVRWMASTPFFDLEVSDCQN